MNRVFIDGERLYLRILQKEDIQGNYIHWFDDEEVCRYNSHHRFPMSEGKATSYVESINSSQSSLVLAMVEKQYNAHIGNISLQGINYFSRSAEFAIILGEKDFWGKGYSKEAGRLIIEHAFDNLGLNRIYCGTTEDNLGMQKLALSLSFKQEGVRRKAEYKNGKYLDIVEYGLLKEECAWYDK